MAESDKELKSLLMKVKEESEKAVLKVNIQEMKDSREASIVLEKTYIIVNRMLLEI